MMKSASIDTLRGIMQWEEYQFTTASHSYLNSVGKRAMDISGAIVGLILGLPIFLLSACIVRIVDRVPPIFSQVRYGFQGKPFVFYKLRTLKVIEKRNTVKIDRIQYKPQYDTTITGRFWRVTSIDEIIQFWLVLKGDMSLMGHRPLPVYYIQYLDQIEGMNSSKLNHYLSIINCYKPGVSSLSSVNGRGDLTMQQKMEYDLIYAQCASFALDFSLLIRTIIAVITQRGAR